MTAKPQKFNQEPGSIDDRFQDLSPELQALYWENRRKQDLDGRAMESWASQGFSSMPVSELDE